jgi:hydroxylaminobenzene mutase
MESKIKIKQGNNLIFFGLILFLLGLAIGLFVHNMANPRMALSAHLEGVMNGMFLMILGLIWNRLVLSEKVLKIVFGLAIYGTFANLSAVMIAAITGFGKMLPIAGGQEGTAVIEGLISFLLISLALCMLALCGFVLVGFYKYKQQQA